MQAHGLLLLTAKKMVKFGIDVQHGREVLRETLREIHHIDTAAAAAAAAASFAEKSFVLATPPIIHESTFCLDNYQ
jgi:hypothetical protein